MRNLGKLTLVLALVSGMNGVEQVAGGGADQPQPPEFRVPTPAGAASFGGVVSDASGKAAGATLFVTWRRCRIYLPASANI